MQITTQNAIYSSPWITEYRKQWKLRLYKCEKMITANVKCMSCILFLVQTADKTGTGKLNQYHNPNSVVRYHKSCSLTQVPGLLKKEQGERKKGFGNYSHCTAHCTVRKMSPGGLLQSLRFPLKNWMWGLSPLITPLVLPDASVMLPPKQHSDLQHT